MRWQRGIIRTIREVGPEHAELPYLIPGFVDAHIHIESSLLVPSKYARIAVRHGTVACVGDPHEIANVPGCAGVRLMRDDGRHTPFHFLFGAPPCVPASAYETAGVELDAALDKLNCGLRVLIREGSAARDFEALHPLITMHPDQVMLCSDDRHPDDLVAGGHDVFDVLRCACMSPIRHYRLPVGLLREGDRLDAVEVADLREFEVQRTWLRGIPAYAECRTTLAAVPVESINRFLPRAIAADELAVPAQGTRLRVIDVRDGDSVLASRSKRRRLQGSASWRIRKGICCC